MLEKVLLNLNNWFVQQKIMRNITVSGGMVDIPELQHGQYFRIVGSVFNDGLHQCPASDLTDESFNGEIWLLAVPQTVIDLANEIAEYNAQHPASGYDSESFGGYSYHAANDGSGAPASWQSVFRNRLNRWRKIC